MSKLITLALALTAIGCSPRHDPDVTTPGGQSVDGRVYEDSKVYDDAHEFHDAHVYQDAHVYEDAHEFHDAHVYMDAPPVVERTCHNIGAYMDGMGSGTHSETLILQVDCGTFTTVGHVLMSMWDDSGHITYMQTDLVCNNNFVTFNVTYPMTLEHAMLVTGSDFHMNCDGLF